jgi:Adenylylsulphate kinase
VNDRRIPLLWLNGPSGVGKTSIGREIYAGLAASGVQAAFLDADQIGMLWPVPEDDPDMHRVKARNLGEVWAVFREAGARCLVLAGGIDTAEQAKLYSDEVPDAAITLCRLRVPEGQLRDRFLGRGWRPEIIDQIVGEAEVMDRHDFADVVVDIGGTTVAEAAALVLERAGGWPGITTGGRF